MTDPRAQFGRLGNQLFQYAFLVNYAKNHDMDWYFQDQFFFEDNKELVRQMFSANIPAPTDKIAIHVRRGKNPLNDKEPAYTDNPFYVDLSKTDYYEKAIKCFPNERFIVFSDDIEWCKRKWGIDDRFEFFHADELTDLNKMASCRGHIIANSSFSWWGAWLSPSFPHNRVVAPSKEWWYSDGIERTVCPNHWIRI